MCDLKFKLHKNQACEQTLNGSNARYFKAFELTKSIYGRYSGLCSKKIIETCNKKW